MNSDYTIKINCPGGILSPGDLYNILVAATKAGVRDVRFGLRQQLLIAPSQENSQVVLDEFDLLNIDYETDNQAYPNITSSYPAEEIFIRDTWLSEGVYKDIFDGMDYRPHLKINISDSNQSFTPMLTGNINWVASATATHFWHLFIRFPKTNTIGEWSELAYTNDVPKLSKEIESIILNNKPAFFGNKDAKAADLFSLINTKLYITKPADKTAVLPPFNLPYYEGLNRYNNSKFWLGIYRRDELFKIEFLKEACLLCLDTKIGQLCSTPWKSLIIKGIEEKDLQKWNRLLEKYQLNMRHPANELNFQVEDNCSAGLKLKHHLVKKFNDDDTRTFGVCIGIKTRHKSEVFSSILVKRKPLLSFFGIGICHVYDILCAHNFNPNERTGFAFSRNNPRFLLAEQLRRSIIAFYNYRSNKNIRFDEKIKPKKAMPKKVEEYVHQCSHCLSVYDDVFGEPENGIAPGTTFKSLPQQYTCALCEGSKENYTKIKKSDLESQAV